MLGFIDIMLNVVEVVATTKAFQAVFTHQKINLTNVIISMLIN